MEVVIMQDNKLLVKLNDKDVSIDVIDIIEKDDVNKKYIIYTIDGDDDNVYMSILDENETTYNLLEIKDENEAKLVEEYLKSVLLEEDGTNG